MESLSKKMMSLLKPANTTVYNLDNVTAKRGTTGKFYCGRKLGQCQCGFCDGYCGPTNGCNCSACKWLDIQQLPLDKVKTNKAGCRAINNNGRHYCGRKLLSCSCCDGYCGPTSGCNCADCKWLDEKVGASTKTNYEGIPAKRGTTGKFYCGRKGILKCYCCNGTCGPDNGCNCNSCKWLDDKENGTTNVKFNKAGVLAAKGDTGRYYCGKKTLTCYCCNGYCGPTNGCNCVNCQALDKEEAEAKEIALKTAGVLKEFIGSVMDKDVSLDVLCSIAGAEQGFVHKAGINNAVESNLSNEKGLHVNINDRGVIVGYKILK